ncbi:serine/threonine protein kinase [Burkholderia gladioli]|uniref:serine/threonine protein kinase n=1 Tax=Burkholderia gladioli TaxID=28095 RepID=UPI00163E79A1|nr:protein kinase [Burkholderia gladioli]
MDSVQAQALIDSLQDREIGGWLVQGSFGFGKSAVVLPATRGGVKAAVKVFHPELIERYGREVQLERIRREKLLIGAAHPNLVKILDGGECTESGHLYVVMEEIPFPNMKEVLETIPFSSIRGFLSQLASAAMFLEERGLAHRDIKPENIAVDLANSRVVLLDLGVLRPFGIANLTDVDQRPFIGTLRYSSPEFLRREESDTPDGWRAITFYQIGAVLHDLLMRKELFAEKSEPYSVLVEAVLHDRPEIYGDDPALVRICNHCLVKKPATRIELVKWDDFHSPDGEASSTVLIRDRIKTRQKYFRSLESSGMAAPSDRVRKIKQCLTNFANRLDTRIGIALNALQCFPPRTSIAHVDAASLNATVSVSFEKDIQAGLEAYLALRFKVELLDENAGKEIYRVTASSVLSSDEINSENFVEFFDFFVGDADELMASSTVEDKFVRVLDVAYSYLETVPAGEVIHAFSLKD